MCNISSWHMLLPDFLSIYHNSINFTNDHFLSSDCKNLNITAKKLRMITLSVIVKGGLKVTY